MNNRGAAGPWTDLATIDIFTVAATPAVSVTATAGWYSTVTASWPEPANGGSAITGYKVRYNGGDWTSLPAGQRSVEYRDIVPDTGARVEVIAVTSQGDSAVGVGTGVPTVPRPPGAPAGLNAVPTADPPSIQINWQEPTINGSPVIGYSYRVYRSNGLVPGWQDTAPDVRSVTVTSGISEGDWVVEVSARSDRGRGDVASTSVHVDPAATPTPTNPGG